MGYREGAGLGAREQGRTVPVALRTQEGKRGLGLGSMELEQGRVNDQGRFVRGSDCINNEVVILVEENVGRKPCQQEEIEIITEVITLD